MGIIIVYFDIRSDILQSSDITEKKVTAVGDTSDICRLQGGVWFSRREDLHIILV
jgi:hypothetical protein